jgi:hypothetical protein
MEPRASNLLSHPLFHPAPVLVDSLIRYPETLLAEVFSWGLVFREVREDGRIDVAVEAKIPGDWRVSQPDSGELRRGSFP